MSNQIQKIAQGIEALVTRLDEVQSTEMQAFTDGAQSAYTAKGDAQTAAMDAQAASEAADASAYVAALDAQKATSQARVDFLVSNTDPADRDGFNEIKDFQLDRSNIISSEFADFVAEEAAALASLKTTIGIAADIKEGLEAAIPGFIAS